LRVIGCRNIYGLFYLPVVIKSRILPNLVVKLSLCVDTGASVTTISDTDALRNEIPIDSLDSGSEIAQGFGGSVRTKKLPDCIVSFMTEENTMYRTSWNYLFIIDRGKNYAMNNPLPSVLGIDFVQDFSISFQNNKIILEK
jgi:hypothetical protein